MMDNAVEEAFTVSNESCNKCKRQMPSMDLMYKGGICQDCFKEQRK